MSLILPGFFFLCLSGMPETRSETVEWKSPTGSLFATLDLPEGKGPYDLVVIHPGSGPTDRDGNQPSMKNDSLKMLGQSLAARGYAALRIDKRGIGASAKALAKEEDIRIGHYADDVIGWMTWARKDGRFRKVAFLGHSEGSLIGVLAGNAAKFDAFISLCGPGRTLATILREQLKANLPENLYKEADRIITELEAGKPVKDPPKELLTLFRPSVQPYLMTFLTPDSAKELAKLTCPVLVVSGSTDIQVTEADFKALATANKAVKASRIENMNHVLKELNTTVKLAQVATYVDPKLPLHPKLTDTICAFLKEAMPR